jgi:hypothetical protein
MGDWPPPRRGCRGESITSLHTPWGFPCTHALNLALACCVSRVGYLALMRRFAGHRAVALAPTRATSHSRAATRVQELASSRAAHRGLACHVSYARELGLSCPRCALSCPEAAVAAALADSAVPTTAASAHISRPRLRRAHPAHVDRPHTRPRAALALRVRRPASSALPRRTRRACASHRVCAECAAATAPTPLLYRSRRARTDSTTPAPTAPTSLRRGPIAMPWLSPPCRGRPRRTPAQRAAAILAAPTPSTPRSRRPHRTRAGLAVPTLSEQPARPRRVPVARHALRSPVTRSARPSHVQLYHTLPYGRHTVSLRGGGTAFCVASTASPSGMGERGSLSPPTLPHR